MKPVHRLLRVTLAAVLGASLAWSGCGGNDPQPPTTTATLSSVTVNPSTVTSGSSSQGNAALTAAAPTGGATIALSSNSAAATVPGTVMVSAGASNASFSIATSGSGTATITGTYAGTSRTAQLLVNPSLVANFVVRSTAAAQRLVGNTKQDIPGLGVGTADACPLVTVNGNPTLACTLDGSTSTAAGSTITEYRWTYLLGTSTATDPTPNPVFTPVARNCGFFGNGQYQPTNNGGVTFINMTVQLRVVNAQGVTSDVRESQNVRVFPAGNCGYAF